ncbi:MAG: DUF4430 domain-containing protein [Candidatus Zixiibacteriota bacterium]|nr:MAG: DUF4430 domain-containing protein [candidate division Zixibacteria bacterium]
MIKESTGFVFFLGLLLIVAGCADSGRNESADSRAVRTAEPPDSAVIVLSGETGKSVLEITREHYSIEYKESPMGAFVNMIDSLETGSGYGWFYTVNDTPGQIAADRHITTDSDTVTWHYRKY